MYAGGEERNDHEMAQDGHHEHQINGNTPQARLSR